MKSNNNKENILDRVTAEIRNETIEPATVAAAADRVWARVSAAAAGLEKTLSTNDLADVTFDRPFNRPFYWIRMSHRRSCYQ